MVRAEELLHSSDEETLPGSLHYFFSFLNAKILLDYINIIVHASHVK